MKDLSPSWYDHYRQALTFWEIANRVGQGPCRFTPDELYLLAGVAIEKFLMTFLVYHDYFPISPGLTDLVSLLDKKGILWKDLSETVKQFERFQSICASTDGSGFVFNRHDVDFFMNVGRSVAEFAQDYFSDDYGKGSTMDADG